MAEDSIRVRRATVADAETVAAFNIAMAEETENLRLDPERASHGARSGLTAVDHAAYYMAETAGRTVGQLMVTTEWSDWRNGFWWWIQSVYVTPDHRRRGVFRRLYLHVRELARARPDVCGLRLYVHRENERAIDTYRGMGMALTSYLVCEEMWIGEHC